MLPAALSIVMNMFGEGAERNKALGIWGGLAAAGATVGLIAGGILTRYAGWQYIFYLNVPIGLAALALVPRVVPESRLATARRRFDAAGAITGTGGLVLLVDAISQAPQYGWDATRTIAVLAASVALLVSFLAIEKRAEWPILPLSIFRLRTLAGANVAAVLLVGSFYAFLFVGTLYMQQVLHFSALQAGLAWLAASRDLARARRCLPAPGHPHRSKAGDGGRDDVDRHRGALGDPSTRPRPFRRQPARAVHRRRRRDGVRVHPGLDRRARRHQGASGRTGFRAP